MAATTLTQAHAQAPLTGHEIRRAILGVIPVYRKTRGVASCRLGDFVAEIGENETACHLGGSNPIP